MEFILEYKIVLTSKKSINQHSAVNKGEKKPTHDHLNRYKREIKNILILLLSCFNKFEMEGSVLKLMKSIPKPAANVAA